MTSVGDVRNLGFKDPASQNALFCVIPLFSLREMMMMMMNGLRRRNSHRLHLAYLWRNKQHRPHTAKPIVFVASNCLRNICHALPRPDISHRSDGCLCSSSPQAAGHSPYIYRCIHPRGAARYDPAVTNEIKLPYRPCDWWSTSCIADIRSSDLSSPETTSFVCFTQ